MPTPSPAPGENAQRGGDEDDKNPFPWWMLLVLLLLALLIWRVREEEPERRARRQKEPEKAFAVLWQALLAARQADGQGILPQETAISYIARTAPEDAGLMSLARAHSALVYGRKAPDEDSLALARIQYRAAWQPLKPWHKARLAVHRALTPVGGYVKKGLDALKKELMARIRR